MKRVRVLVWCPHISLGGGLRLLMQLVPAIARHRDVELVRLAVPSGRVKNDRFNFQSLPIEFVELTQARDVSAFRSWIEKNERVLSVKGTGRLKGAMRKRLSLEAEDWEREQLSEISRDCDVVYAFWPHHHAFPVLGKPVVCTYQDTTLLDFPEILGGKETAALWELSDVWMRRANRVVVSSEATKTNLLRVFGQHCESAVVIHHAISPVSESNPTPVRSSSMSAFSPGSYMVLPAHVSSSKNHYTLLAAWSRFRRRKEFPLVMFGPGTEKLTLAVSDDAVAHDRHLLRIRGLIARNQLRSGQDFHGLGYVEDADVMPLVKNASALIMPTLAEGGGSYPVEEALSVGVPVLCSDIPVMREHLAGRTAKIGWFDPESADSIHRALCDLVENYDEYKQLAMDGVHDSRPTWDEVGAQYVEVFRQVVK